jgi:HlyD family secretion protein
MKKKGKRRLIIIAGAVVIVLVVIGYFAFFNNNKEQYRTEAVSYGEVLKEVSETGAVKVSDRVDLSFEYGGKIDQIYVKVGDRVFQGDKLAEVDTDQLYIQLADANAALAVAQANYDNLLAGSSAEEIQVAKTDVDNAQVTLDTKKQSLIDVQADASEDLEQAYEDAMDYLDSSYLTLYNASKDIDNIQVTYFGGSDQPSLNVKESRDILRNGVADAKTYIAQAKVNNEKDKIDAALSKMKEILSKAKDALAVVRNMAEEPDYKNVVSSANKTIIDNDKSYINTAYTNIVSASQAIATTRIANETNINTAEAAVSSAEVALQKSKDQLALKEAGPTQENIDLYSARVKQAEAQVLLLNNKIQKSALKSPGSGQIVDIGKRVGEVVQATSPVMQFMPQGNFQITVDIYEEDIVYVKPGDSVRVSIPAFPNDELIGRVVSINPAEKIVSEVVYYEVTIDLLDQKEGMKPGMTADVVIEAAKKENVLRVPRGAVKNNNGNKVVKILKGNNVEERQVEVGLEGSDYVEIISGVSEGEEIIIG